MTHDDGVAGVCEHTPRPSYTCKQVETELGAQSAESMKSMALGTRGGQLGALVPLVERRDAARFLCRGHDGVVRFTLSVVCVIEVYCRSEGNL